MVSLPFGSGKNDPGKSRINKNIVRTFSATGIHFGPEPAQNEWLHAPTDFGTQADLVSLLSQLEDEGYTCAEEDGLFLSWADVYRIYASPSYRDSCGLLGLPAMAHWRPALTSRGTLTDPDFSVVISAWVGPNGQRPAGNVSIEGALLSTGMYKALLPESVWATLQSVAVFYRRPATDRNPNSNRQGWAAIRANAIAAGADLSDFLARTIVISPEMLTLELRKGDAFAGGLVEIMPGFEGQPSRWLEIFDRLSTVQDRYDIPDGAGIVHVLLRPEAVTVLRKIKRMPGRRITGDRAEAFIRNPFATLGPDAARVIDPVQFEAARDAAGIAFAQFIARVRRDERDYPYDIALVIVETVGGNIRAEECRFEGADELSRFLATLEARMADGAQCCFWQGFELEILGDTPDQAAILRQALEDLQRPGKFKASEILDLSLYSERVEGFGVEKPYYSPFIARKNEDGGWFPDNVEFGLCYTPKDGGETVALVLTEETLNDFRAAVNKASAEGQTSFSFPGCPKPVPVEWAKDTIASLGQANEDVAKGRFDPGNPKGKGLTMERKGLVVKPNVDRLDYEEYRGDALAFSPATYPRLPQCLKTDIALKDHQRTGLAWLQNLWSKSPAQCRGALLADDMGLGKTIQLLTFMAAALEENPRLDPFLVVAPVSLLENWQEEIAKFFSPGSLPVLTLYGSELAGKRLPREAVEEELVTAGITRLLKHNWIGNAKIVLTTYETLRDLEFSLAMRKWSAMVCDEAQKIKNPNAMVTRAAKKQNARFKIACTGTPVENTLTDIWCLFDFVQPGLLGSLKEFGERYRRPIEAETDEEKARVEELRNLIEPQKLRRTKLEVAKDLPRKIEVAECRSLRISERQRAHYADAVGIFKRRDKSGPGVGIQSHLGLLQYLRRLCSDPRPPGRIGTSNEPVAELVAHSPKMAWLLRQLEDIRAKEEKAILFCEFRDLQRTLQQAVADRFGITPDIINGNTSAASANANNRQKRIKAFQLKPGFGAIILSPLAVGFGVNIQAANHVIHFTRTWNPAKEDQATDRAYRIGQTKDVFVYYPVVVADDFTTFDAQLDILLERKRGLSHDMLNGVGELALSDFGDIEAPEGGSAFGEEILTPQDLATLNPDAFEAFCAILWSKLGYTKTIKTPRVGDGGVDVVAISGKDGVLIQCKSSAVDGRELGWDGVKDVVAGSAAYAARYPGVHFKLVTATNRRFNSTAREQAKFNHVELVDEEGLAVHMRQIPIRRFELENFLFAGWGA